MNAPARPPSPPPTSEVIPIERLTAPRDRFRCERLRCVLRVEDCVERQKTRIANPVSYARREDGRALYPSCATCDVGKGIAARFPALRDRPARKHRRRGPVPTHLRKAVLPVPGMEGLDANLDAQGEVDEVEIFAAALDDGDTLDVSDADGEEIDGDGAEDPDDDA